MAKKQITIEIEIGGETTVSTTGYKGKSCRDVTRAFETALGKVVSTRDTAEMQERPLQQQNPARQQA